MRCSQHVLVVTGCTRMVLHVVYCLFACILGSQVLCCLYWSCAVQMDQKHAVEDVLLGAGLPGLMLESTMFMEEFWKKYTRPGLINGTFTFSLPGTEDRGGAVVGASAGSTLGAQVHRHAS
eukprot:GHUV01045222.1.p2 GENE.GHUV01045222.1~~GHUV01045222.1.p2  ORF type:complete len:121 (-),score=24.63 GHUV01045222.1:434-796(-)